MEKLDKTLQKIRIPFVLALLITLLMPSAHAFDATAFCNSIIPSSSPGLTSFSTLDSLIGISLIIMLAMALVAGIAYMLGYSLSIDGLIEFSKEEFGEIVITIIVVFILVGTFSVTSTLTPPKLITNTGAYSRNVFINDCSELSSSSIALVPTFVDIAISQEALSLISSLKISIKPNDFGFSFSPLQGYGLVGNEVGNLMTMSALFAGMMIGVAALLGVFYAIMPFFLFIGIILRTLPFSRPAGGALLGLFAGFFIVFPILLYFMLSSFGPTVSAGSLCYVFICSQSGVNGITAGIGGNITGALGSIVASTSLALLSPSVFIQAMLGLITADVFALFAIIFSFIVSYDFMEAVGDILGAPSLRSGNTLKRLL